MDQRISSRTQRASLQSGSAGAIAERSPSGGPAPRTPSAQRPSLLSSTRSPSAGKSLVSLSLPKVPDGTKGPRRISGMSRRTLSKDENRSSAIAATTPAIMSAPPQITADALASINYAAFTQGSLSAKQRRARMLKDFLAAHSSGAQRIAEACEADNEAMWSAYLQHSHGPHSREIQRLLNRTLQVETSCQQRLQHANAITRCALGGIEEVLVRLTKSGTRISAATKALSGEPDAVLAAGAAGGVGGAAHGTPLEEVRSFDPSLPEPHPPAFLVAEADRAEMTRLQGVFQRATDSITAHRDYGSFADAFPFSSPVKPPDAQSGMLQQLSPTPAADSPTSMLGSGGSNVRTENRSFAFPLASVADDQERLRQVDELRRELNAVGEAFTSLMQRVEVQHGNYQATITAQRAALDAAATRTKLADDVLRDTVAQGEVEACSAVAEVQRLSIELRRRMDAIEVAMQGALNALIDESAEVCVANDALYDHAALTLNRENCLYAYMSKMERQVVEQADVLRQAQDTVTRLWSRLHAPPGPSFKGGEAAGKKAAVPADLPGSSGAALIPPIYLELLRQSDRPTLLTLVEQLSHHSADVAAELVRSLDRDQAHKAIHPADAAAAREAHLRSVTTQQLLEKLDAEGHLRSNTRETTLPLSQRITHLVAQYDAFIDFNEQYARALVRQADGERREQVPSQFAFFDSRTPAPGPKGSTGSLSATRPKSGDKRASPRSHRITTVPSSADSRTPPAPVLPYLQLWKSKQQPQQPTAPSSSLPGADNVHAATTGDIVNYLAHASACMSSSHNAPTAAGIEPARASPGGVSSPQPAPPVRMYTAVSATASGAAQVRTPPPPPVPPRAGLTSYVLSTYASPGEDTATLAGKRALPYRDGDRQFIEREREVFLQLD